MYLSNRHQLVKVNNNCSEIENISTVLIAAWIYLC